MNAVGKKRLLKLADFLDKLPPEKFDFSEIAVQKGKPMREALKAGRTRCGTVGCAIGWMPAAFPRSLRWDETRGWATRTFPDVCLINEPTRVDFDAAVTFFGITSADAYWLFQPGGWRGLYASEHNGLHNDATPKQVAKHIRKFVREQEKADV